MFLAVFVTRRFTRPILDLVRATEAVGQGNFSTRVPVRRRDEVGRLSAAFNTMTADLALKEKYRHVLDRVTDREIAEQLLNGELSLGGELRQASVLFCDIRGFTTLTEGMDPVAVIEMLNLHMTALTNVVHRHHGVVDKFVGDALMAIFGAPKSYGADAFDAAACALDLMVERQRLNVAGGRVIEIGIGVTTGQVVAGCTGSAERLNYTVLGDRVNLAARLCSRAMAGEIYIDENTRAALSDDVEEVEAVRESLVLKGFAQPVPVFRLHILRTVASA
jgi:class 3 adenylate cyclase